VLRQYAVLDVDECDSCGGLMLAQCAVNRVGATHDALTDLQRALPRRPRLREERVVYLRCPRCQNLMNRRAFGRVSGIVVDVCRDHGVWFDAGKFSDALAFVANGGLARAKEFEEAELRATRRALNTQWKALRPESQGNTSERSEGAEDVIVALADLWM
jgi:Zn-finger nucleic acid-binding protein